jgi:four helix bundle protein
MKRLKELIVYQKSKELVKSVYKVLESFPDAERFALCNQIRRAVVSIPSNIAEGMGRVSDKDQAHFLNIAYGSVMETYAQLDIAHDLGYINDDIFNQLENDVEEVSKMISVMASLRTISPSSRSNKN